MLTVILNNTYKIVLLDKSLKVLNALRLELEKIKLKIIFASTDEQKVKSFLKSNNADLIFVSSDFKEEDFEISHFVNKDLKIVKYYSVVSKTNNADNIIEFKIPDLNLNTGFISSSFSEKYSIKKPTQREIEVLKLIATGLKIKEISKKLNISYYTAENHKKNLLMKLNVKNVASLVHLGHKLNYLS